MRSRLTGRQNGLCRTGNTLTADQNAGEQIWNLLNNAVIPFHPHVCEAFLRPSRDTLSPDCLSLLLAHPWFAYITTPHPRDVGWPSAPLNDPLHFFLLAKSFNILLHLLLLFPTSLMFQCRQFWVCSLERSCESGKILPQK